MKMNRIKKCIKKTLTVFKIVNTYYRNGIIAVKKHLKSNLALGAINYLSFLVFFAVCVPPLQLILKSNLYNEVHLTYIDTSNKIILITGLIISAILLYVSKIYLLIKNIFTDDTASRASKQYGSSWIILLTLSYLIDLFGLTIIFFANIFLSFIHFQWVDHETLAYIILNICGFVFWLFIHSFSNLLVPISMMKTFTIGESFKYSWHIYWKKKLNIYLVSLYLRFILWDILSFFTSYLAYIYVYPVKLSSVVMLINERTKQ